MLEIVSDVVIVVFPFLVYMFIGINRKKWLSWTQNKQVFFLLSWLAVSAVLVYSDLYILVLVSIVLFLIELYL
ncbi:hypothetical protein K5E_08240 [Enterococcus thailandicus]|uniref:Uncharacterized protein n=2 Tax=root TaxID=1 RepID=A0A249SKL7_ENTTH|nr:hypothetical protein CK496_09165 [Enterococcus thailandicus]GEK36571.1 hypothetical protein ETH01_08580 [Enterococcus thailandicus]GMC04839.1 hypothetical protein K4E_24190 [Enterococcus thailandicus]GMC08685.1 hypothetical protein K5E_08240 [Enterococcus thailandicus]